MTQQLAWEDQELVTTRLLNALKHLGVAEGEWDGVIEYVAEGFGWSFWEDTSKLTPVVTYIDHPSGYASGTTRYLRTIT